MRETIEGRDLIELKGRDGIVRGTYHRARCRNSGGERPRIGLLFLSGLSQTRAANGDSAVYWARSLAECGYPVVRLDLPGFGDSDGDPSTELLAFINRGGYAPIVSAAIDELVTRFDLAGVIIVGHCTGTVSAIFTAANNKRCKGLVLLDPIFYVPQAESNILKVRRRVHDLVLRCHLDAFLTKIYDSLRELWLSLRGSAPPENANFPLLGRWKELASTGLPILILRSPGSKAPGTKTRTGEFDYLKHVLELAGRKSRVEFQVAEGANHSFANGQGRIAVLELTEHWLRANFPLAEPDNSNATTFSDAPTLRWESGVAK